MICPACALTPLTPLADLGDMPVACGTTFPSAADARRSPRGRMSLAGCPRCGHVVNAAFDPDLAHFDASMEAALFHSPTYTDYALGVVDRLVSRYELAGRRVLEIASGSPVLLDRLTSLGCAAVGVPGLTGPSGGFDLVLARFVLEHVPDPLTLLRSLPGTHAFIEVPDAAYDLTTAGWDCIYPHVGYFGAESLTALCARAGWRVLDIGTAFNGQYLWAELVADHTSAQATMGDRSPTRRPAASAPVRHDIQFEAATTRWRDALADRRTVVWGAGTRGTMFCNRVDPDGDLLLGVVDRNPAKHHRYLPVAGHRVIAPADLPHLAPDTVVLTNPAYRTEIAEQLAAMGLSPALLVA